jgi:hypothetical protein
VNLARSGDQRLLIGAGLCGDSRDERGNEPGGKDEHRNDAHAVLLESAES